MAELAGVRHADTKRENISVGKHRRDNARHKERTAYPRCADQSGKRKGDGWMSKYGWHSAA